MVLETAMPSVAQWAEQFSHLGATLLQGQKQDACSQEVIYYHLLQLKQL